MKGRTTKATFSEEKRSSIKVGLKNAIVPISTVCLLFRHSKVSQDVDFRAFFPPENMHSKKKNTSETGQNTGENVFRLEVFVFQILFAS